MAYIGDIYPVTLHVRRSALGCAVCESSGDVVLPCRQSGDITCDGGVN